MFAAFRDAYAQPKLQAALNKLGERSVNEPPERLAPLRAELIFEAQLPILVHNP